MSRLAQTYIHLRPFNPGRNASYYADLLQARATVTARDLFGADVHLNIDVELGSLRAWATVLGTLYVGIGQYGDFRSGVDNLVNDSRRLSQAVSEGFLQDVHVSPAEVYRVERRLEDPGRLRRLLREFEALERDQRAMTNAQRESALHAIRAQLSELVDGLENEEERRFVERHLPLPIRPDRNANHDRHINIPNGSTRTEDEEEEEETPTRVRRRHRGVASR